MRTYYRGPDAVVTSELFVWRTTPAKIFVIRELRKVGITCTAIDRSRPPTVQAAAGSVALAVAVWPVVETPALVALGLLAITVPGIVVAAYRRTRPRLWELHASYRGGGVILFADTNARVFNQIARALRRAIEESRPHATWSI
ncbi:DUF6232 family protein [Actinoplanes sp. NBRC 103695]|uniref:DUF6232 family protein n=1 Tax=Actinoplanes sp. NBRC 103695 TaxID=3032202 RepID=UPI0024A5B06E|nr:DUF6232 family protein [Actinoplanes sp. NBRC 103695]GLY98184.1 hypothetical protein Acsp02_54380 [Actinoplanes sp. NBRC 103695]